MFYKITAEIYKSKNNRNDKIKINKIFKNHNLYLARKNCFSYYHSLIDVLLQSIGKKYTTHKQAEIDLQDFFIVESKFTDPRIKELWDGLGIEISFVYNSKIECIYKDLTIYEGEMLIQGMGFIHDESKYTRDLYDENLIIESSIYKEKGITIQKNQ